MTIFFVSCRQPFNADFAFHAEAKTPDEAGAKALGFLKKRGIIAVVDSVVPALRQNKKKYSFPSSIL